MNIGACVLIRLTIISVLNRDIHFMVPFVCE